MSYPSTRPIYRFVEHGQGLVEYALLLILVGVAVVIVLAATGTSISSIYCQVIVA